MSTPPAIHIQSGRFVAGAPGCERGADGSASGAGPEVTEGWTGSPARSAEFPLGIRLKLH
jgi:hypothetical protein